MAKYKIMIGRPCVGGSHRAEVSDWVTDACLWASKQEWIEDVIRAPISRTPTPVARNVLAHQGRANGVDILFVVDDDMRPAPGFFEAAIDFLLKHQGPAVIASPYCTAPPLENVCVFEWAQGETGAPDAPFAVTNIVREDAARRTGTERVANIGTGLIAYKMSAFEKISHPWFDYGYSDETHTQVIETEDCWNARKLSFAGVPLYVHWDFWSAHRKSKWVVKPVRLIDANVESVFMRQARAEVKHERKHLESKDGDCEETSESCGGWVPPEVMADALKRMAEKLDREFMGEAHSSPLPKGAFETTVLNAKRVACPVKIDPALLDKPSPPGMEPTPATITLTKEQAADEDLAQAIRDDFVRGHQGGIFVAKDGVTYAPDRDTIKAIVREVLAEPRPSVVPTAVLGTPDPERIADPEYAADACEVWKRIDFEPQREPFPVSSATHWACSVPGWMTCRELLFLGEQAGKLPAGGRWLEVGTWKGRSLSAAFLAAPDSASVLCVDTWDGTPSELDGPHKEASQPGDLVYKEFLGTVRELRRLRPNGPALIAWRKPSVEAARDWTTTTLDVVFLDGDHDYAHIYEDIGNWMYKLKPGGLLIGHDRYLEGVSKALARCFGRGEVQEGPGSLWFVRMPLVEHEEPASVWDALEEQIDEPSRNGEVKEVAA